MKNFHFRLAQVRDYRRQQLEFEEAKLQTLAAERRALEAEAARIETEAGDTRRLLMLTGSAESQDLATSDAYLRHLSQAKTRQAGRLANWHARALEQRKAIIEARRRVRLLEHLEGKQRREWQSQADREQENLAAELYLARRNKN